MKSPGSMLARIRWAKTPKAARTAGARKAALVRWQKAREKSAKK